MEENYLIGGERQMHLVTRWIRGAGSLANAFTIRGNKLSTSGFSYSMNETLSHSAGYMGRNREVPCFDFRYETYCG
jgi:hypothetical protein